MNFSRFFIDRPIFAAVLSIVILIVGGISYFQLPVSQYPEVALPTVVVRAMYTGATPETIAETVATPLEQEINGVDDMLYMGSQSTSDGASLARYRETLVAQVDRRRCRRRATRAKRSSGAGANGYASFVGRLLRFGTLMLVVNAGLIGLTWFGFKNVPGGFIPAQDLGYLIVAAQLPDGASIQRTDAVAKKITEIALDTEGVSGPGSEMRRAIGTAVFSGIQRYSAGCSALRFLGCF